MPVTLADMLFREFGVRTYPRFNPLVSTVLATVVRVFSNNPNRLAWVMVNLGANDLYFVHSPEVSATNGILLANSGGGINYKWDEEFDLVGYDVYAVAPVGPTAILCYEIVTRDAPSQIPVIPALP